MKASYCYVILLLRITLVFQQVFKAILSTLYNSYWIRIRKTDNDLVPFRTDDPFDQVLPYENWADFQTEEDDRKWSRIWLSTEWWFHCKNDHCKAILFHYLTFSGSLNQIWIDMVFYVKHQKGLGKNLAEIDVNSKKTFRKRMWVTGAWTKRPTTSPKLIVSKSPNVQKTYQWCL